MKVLEFQIDKIPLDNMEEFLTEDEKFLIWMEYSEPKVRIIDLKEFSYQIRLSAIVKGKILSLQNNGNYSSVDSHCEERKMFLPMWLQEYFPKKHIETQKKKFIFKSFLCKDCDLQFKSHLKFLDVVCTQCRSIHINKYS